MTIMRVQSTICSRSVVSLMTVPDCGIGPPWMKISRLDVRESA
jgi:hypothetical protein